ncbi:MAG: hypothetical protein EZS28_023280 [Streblomastix strix]|uniref:SPRY domain-containing protein n=1 Tax=Streblomastix strix TaxID=222440 RepID=A0A5J4VFI3_9EUKA|nr:MAG: hypothetical protein EZS28_023280 [Streblomastix strix]
MNQSTETDETFITQQSSQTIDQLERTTKSTDQFDLIDYIPIGLCLEDVNIEETTFTHTKENENYSTIQFDPLISAGIVKIEFKNIKELSAVGIVENNIDFGRHGSPFKFPHNTVRYWQNIGLQHCGSTIKGNADFYHENQTVAMEVNMDSNPRTLKFFVDDEEQQFFVVDIPQSIRFFAYFFEKGAKFQLTQFVRLYCPSTKKGKGVKGAQWLKYGKEWQQSEYSQEQSKQCKTQ